MSIRLPGTRFRLHVSDFHVTWRLHGGFDWEVHRREAAAAAALGKERQRQANEANQATAASASATASTSRAPVETAPTYTGDMIDEDASSDASDTASETFTEVTQVPLLDSEQEDLYLRAYRRSKSAKLEAKLLHINVEAEVYEPDQRDAFRVRLGVRDVEILDHIHTSVWRKFLTAMRPDGDATPRESASSMIRVNLSSVRPDLTRRHREELRVKVIKLLSGRSVSLMDMMIIRFDYYH